MARISDDPYTAYHIAAKHKPGTLCDGVDNVLGLPAVFRYVKHVNAVAVVRGHCAQLTAVSAGVFTVTNDVSGGATASLDIGVGAYCVAVPENYWSWILVVGYHDNLLGDGSVATTEAIMTKAADGTWDSHTGADKMLGVAVTSDSGSPTVFAGFINCL